MNNQILTREQILNMPAGRELDALIGKKVLELEINEEYPFLHRVRKNTFDEIPSYSTDISAAWEVVEKMKETFNEIQLYWFVDHWEAWFGSNETVENESAPLAICRAALLAVIET